MPERTIHISRRHANAALLGLLALPGCGPVRSPRIAIGGGGGPTLSAALKRVDMVPGRPLLTPVRVAGPLPGSAAPTISVPGLEPVPGRLVWIGYAPRSATAGSWLPRVDRWVVAPVEQSALPASIGAWHVVADLPREAVGKPVRVGDQPLPVNWLADPDSLAPAGGLAWGPWRPAGEAPDPDLLTPEWQSPLRRWRARLATDALGGPDVSATPWPVDGEAGVLDDMAELIEARWRVGLARLWYADEATSVALTTRLGLSIEIEPGVRAPAWPVGQPLLDSLLADLLDPDLTGEALTARARGWLESLPTTAAWVADDAAGLIGSGSDPLAQIRAARLADAPTLLWLTGRGADRVGEPRALQPASVTSFAAPVNAGVPSGSASRFAVRAGAESIGVLARPAAEIRPPGANCAPLLHDWTLAAWSASDPAQNAVPAGAWATAALVYREERGGWAAFIECGSPAVPRQPESGPGGDEAEAADPDGEAGVGSVAEAPAEEVAIYLGQRGTPAAVLRVSSGGTLRDDLVPGGESELQITRQRDRWSAVVPIPESAIEPNLTLRVGITRRDARGVRTAWPRRMFPWEREPSRAAIRLGTWSGLS